jgi:two-component system sensor histidine kinase KdpD
VFFNLLENAAHYSLAGSQIEITARVEDGRVEIRVADNGPGLPTGAESRVFEKFFRGSTAMGDGRRGAGLGLAICRAVIEAHGGRISARNRRGGGAEFILSLPCEEKAPHVALDETAASGGS